MNTPNKPRPPNLKLLPELPPQVIYKGRHLNVDKKITAGTKIHNLEELSKEFKYMCVGDDFAPYIEFGNEIIPPGHIINKKYADAVKIYDEVVYDNECRLAKYEQDMIKYRKYVEQYRAWRLEQKEEVLI